jgi:hypothetical protein
MNLTQHIVNYVLKLSQPKDSYTIHSINRMESGENVIKHLVSG